MTHPGTYQLTEAERARAEHVDQLVVANAVDELIETLSETSWTVRRAAVAGLASLGDDAVAPLCVWLCDRRTSEHAIAAAVDALVASVGSSATAQVTSLLADPRPEVAADAAQILGRRRAGEAVSALCRAVEQANDNVAIAAIEALGLIGGSGGIETLIAATRTGVFFRVFAALRVLARVEDPRALEPLVALLADPIYRHEAALALGQTGAARAIAPLASLLHEGSTEDTVLVACAFGDLIARAESDGSGDHVETVLRATVGDAAPRFAALLPAETREDTHRIALVVGRLGGIAELQHLAALIDDQPVDGVTDSIQRIASRHQDVLGDVIADADSRVRAALLPIVTSRRTAETVRELLSDDDDHVRALACQALGRLGDIASVPLLFGLLETARPAVALAATAAIQSLGAAETQARTIRLIREGSTSARRHALRIVSYLGFASAFDAVSAATQDPDPRIAELAITALGTLHHPRTEEVMDELVAPASPGDKRAAAMRAISLWSTPHAVELLVRGLDDELPWVRYYACQGLGRLASPAFTGALIAKLRDSSPHVRLAAIEALAALDAPAAWTALVSSARSDDLDEQRAAMLGIGSHPREAGLPILLAAARSADLATQMIGLSGLARLPGREALDCITAVALDAEAELREAAVSLLAERDDRDAAEALVDVAVGAEDASHPAHAALSVPAPARIAAIRSRCETADERAAITLTAALARMHVRAATAALLELLELPNPVARRVAASVLTRIGHPDARELVARMSREDPDPEVRRVCAAASEGFR